MKSTIHRTLIIQLLLSYTIVVKAQTVSIPDAVFRFKLLNHDPIIDLNHDGEIQNSEAEAFAGLLDVSYGANDPGYINDLSGLEAFLFIEEFKATNQAIQFIDLSNNSLLRLFDASGNPFTSLSFTNHPFLEAIQSNFGSLENLDISGAPNLVFLNAQANNLSLIDFTSNPSLQGLQLDDNPIGSYDFSKNPQLRYIYCSNNSISTLDLSLNKTLVAIDCQDNHQLGYINLRNGNNEGLNLTGAGPSCAFYDLPELETVCLDDINSPLAKFIEDHVGHTITFTEDCTLGFEPSTAAITRTFPNPTDGILDIDSKTPISEIKIFNISGHLLWEQTIDAFHHQLNINTLSDGLYFLLVLYPENKKLLFKIIKK